MNKRVQTIRRLIVGVPVYGLLMLLQGALGEMGAQVRWPRIMEGLVAGAVLTWIMLQLIAVAKTPD